MRMMCYSDKTWQWPPVKHGASLALIIDRAEAPLEGFTRGENIIRTTSIVYHRRTVDCAQTKWTHEHNGLSFLGNLPIKFWVSWEDHELYAYASVSIIFLCHYVQNWLTHCTLTILVLLHKIRARLLVHCTSTLPCQYSASPNWGQTDHLL